MSNPPYPGRRTGLLAGLTLLVLLFHGWLLAGLPLGLGDDARPSPAPLRVREIVRARAPAPPPEAPPAAAVPPRPTPRPAAMAAARPVPPAYDAGREPAPPTAERSDPPAPPDTPPDTSQTPTPAPQPEPADPAVAAAEPASAPPVVPVDAALVQVAAAVAPVRTADAGERMPVYPTRLPPAATLQFELRRGLLTGEGTLEWRPTGTGYELQFEGRAFGLSLLGWASRGAIDAHGLAPERYLDRRRGKDVRAANFQRDKGLITYSTTTAQHELQPGAQDRLSWMLQLAAVVAADPARFGPGERVAMQVVGARGDAGAWLFEVIGREPLELPAGPVADTLRLRREPRKAYDTVVEVWLDPARHHLPVRLKLATAGGDDAMEFLLKP